MSEATEAASAFVAARLASAHDLGARLADLVTDPFAFAAELSTGLVPLADAAYAAPLAVAPRDRARTPTRAP